MGRARVQTTLVERRAVTLDLRLVGKLAYDETRVRTISAWLPGRLDRLYVDYVGVSVKAGDHLGHTPERQAADAQCCAGRLQ